MTASHRALAEYDGWIFSASGQTAIKGRNGSTRRLTDLHYNDEWKWLMPVYMRLCVRCGEHRESMMRIQSAILLNDIEMACELMGKLIMEIKKVRV